MELLQNDNVPELYLPSPAPPGGALAYLLARGSEGPPPRLSLEESWAQWPGAYLFLPAPVAAGTEAAFAAAAWAFLEDRRLAGTRFAWLQVPPPPGLVSGTTIQVQGSGPGSSLAFAATLPLISLELGLAAETTVELDSAAEAFRFSAANPGGIGLRADWGDAPAGSVSGPATLPLNGPLAGCMQAAVAFALADLDTIDAGLRYFYAAPPRSPAAPATPNFFLDSLRLPLFATGVSLYTNLDPLAPLAAARSFFAFHGADAGQPAAPEPVPTASYLRTTLGEPVALKPLSGSDAPSGFAALVLAPKPLASVATPRDPAYLVPRGDFAPEAAGAQLMCGLSGVESVGLAAAGSVLSFFPGAAAFATGFAPGKPPGYSSLEPTDTPTTAFAQLTAAAAGARLKYFAQPDQSVLYNHGALAPSGFTALSAVPVQAGELAGPPSASHAFPLLPYAGLDGDELEPFGQLEAQVVSPLRRARVAASQSAPDPEADPAAALPSRLSTTPQGLLAAYVPGAPKWEEVVLGQMADGSQLRLTGVEAELLTAFQSNKLFLVATLPGSMSALKTPGAQIVIGGKAGETWTFDLDPSQWRSQPHQQTVVVLKFHEMAIAELAKDPSTWASGGFFNKVPTDASAAMLEAIDAADPNDPDFAAFLTAVNDPNWNGVLALNVKCPLQQLPAQLAGLAAGIEAEDFYAHHVGIALSQIDASGSQLAISSSSIFGLLDYTAPAPLPAQAGEYAFQVERLKVRFEESAVASFSSIVDLQVNRLFGEPATLKNPSPSVAENVVQLYGVYLQHVVAGKVEGTYTFQTRSGQVSEFAMTSAVLNAVTLAKGQFVTVGGSSGETVSQFVFWGQLDFQQLPFDAFSFGRNVATEPATGLAFGNLIVTMDFNPAAQPPGPTFEFDAAQLSLDAAGSKAREPSLFHNFPLTVAGFSQGKNGTTPDGLGYMGLQTPLTQSPLTYPWFALTYDLDLGSAGALAAEAGFVASLCVAWSPDLSPSPGAGYRVFTGLRLPGSSGSKRQIPIEGIFDIGFRALAIESPAADTYALVLYGIGFQFLSFTFPPSGQVNFTLFGDPNPSGADDTTLGWYAAYAKPDAKPAQR